MSVPKRGPATIIRQLTSAKFPIRIDDLRSPRDLAQIAYDVGVQLGAGSLKELAGFQRNAERQRELASLARLERRIRNKTSELVGELVAGWIEFARR